MYNNYWGIKDASFNSFNTIQCNQYAIHCIKH